MASANRTASCMYRILGRELTRNYTYRTCCNSTYHTIKGTVRLSELHTPCFSIHHGRLLSTSSVHHKSATEILQNLNAEEQFELKKLMMWYEYERLNDGRLPGTLADQQWIEFLQLERNARYNKLVRLFVPYSMRLSKGRKATENEIAEKNKSTVEGKSTENEAGISKMDALFLSHRKQIKAHYKMYKSIEAKQFAPTVVFDFEFASRTTTQTRGMLVLLRNLSHYHFNELRYPPLNVVICNFKKTDFYRNFLKSDAEYNVGGYNIEDKFLVTEKSYLEMFPLEQLIYLLPGHKKVRGPMITTYNASDIFVVGVQPGNGKSYLDTFRAKAMRENIRFAKFPFHLHKSNKFSLFPAFLDPVKILVILNALHSTRSWEDAVNTLHTLNPIDDRVTADHSTLQARREEFYKKNWILEDERGNVQMNYRKKSNTRASRDQ